jgi:hypothetical protein
MQVYRAVHVGESAELASAGPAVMARSATAAITARPAVRRLSMGKHLSRPG